MPLAVTNTLSGEREAFEVEDDEVLLYVCGLTVSDDAHLGHARAWVHADIIHRWLSHLGYEVRHVENVTDVNEKITARVGERDDWETETDVARQYTADIFDDMRGLNLLRADVYPRVSEHVPEIIQLVEELLEKGYAYEANGSVYFDVTTFDSYGRLSNQELDELEAQGDPSERSEKRNPADFALWKAGAVSDSAIREHRKHEHDGSLPAGQTWNAPWGQGRPGWHIECSAMSMSHLGETIDIHMGGRDLVFPHHENEIAQSEAATDATFVRYWLHNGLLETSGEKMSSSLGNYWTVSDALSELGINVVRTFYAGAQYRTDQALSEDALEEAQERFQRLQRAYEAGTEAADSVDAGTKTPDESLRAAVDTTREEFTDAMNADFNVREATTALLDLAAAVNRHVENSSRYDYPGLKRAIETFDTFGQDVLGLQFTTEPGEGEVRLAEELVELVIEIREQEREAGNFDRADALRAALSEVGVEVEDSPDGPEYRFE